jgi:hypothetical protein
MSETLLLPEATPRLVDAATGLITPAPENAKGFSIDGQHLIAYAGSAPATIRVHLTADMGVYWDLPMGKTVLGPLFGSPHLVVHSGLFLQAVSYLDGSVLWSVSRNGAISITPAIDAPIFFRTTDEEVPRIQRLSAESGSVTATLSSNSSSIVVSAAGGYAAIPKYTGVEVYNTTTGALVGLIPYPPASGSGSQCDADIHPDGDRIVVIARGDADTAGVYSLPGLALQHDLTGVMNYGARYSPGGSYLYGILAPIATVYDANTLEALHNFEVNSLGVSWGAEMVPPVVPRFWTGLKQSSEIV